jgi:hypothetical protein
MSSSSLNHASELVRELLADILLNSADETSRFGAADLDQSRNRLAVSVGERYAKGFLERGIDSILLNSADGRRRFDITIASNDTDLRELTKRGSLIADRLVLCHASVGDSYPVSEKHTPPQRDGLWISDDVVKRYGPAADVLGSYILDSSPLMEAGRIIYSPNYHRIETGTTAHYDFGDAGLIVTGSVTAGSESRLVDLLVAGRRVIEKAPGSEVKAGLLEPLLVLDLPCIEGTSFHDFCRISVEESDNLVSLQNYLRQRLLQINMESPQASFALAQLEAELSDGIRAVRAEMQRLMRKRAIQQAGAALATTSAILLNIAGKEWATALSILGASGGLWSGVTATEAYMTDKSRVIERPYYFLWLISKAAKRS